MIDLVLTENDAKAFEKAMHDEMGKAVKHFEGELIKIRTGRAHTSLIEDIYVSCYGAAPMPLKTIASLAAPESRLLTIQPWDAGIISDIERAIRSSDLGVSPINDGALIRIQLPEMSTTRREELSKILGKKAEECRVAIRNVRKDFHNLVRDGKKDKVISENFFNRLSDILEKITGTYIDKIDQIAYKKEQDIRTV
jgi:ribosome recycling factor